MKASKAIFELQKLIAEYGDQEVTVYNGDPVDPASIECEKFIVNKTPDGNVTFEAS
jgi:hypothetical protein